VSSIRWVARSANASEEDSYLLSYVPRHVAELVLREPGRSPVATEQRFEAATIFADISGFTAMSEALGRIGGRGTEELSVLLNDYFGTLIALIESRGGIVGKLAGDALTVLFPVEGASASDAARRALWSALEMQAARGRFAKTETSAGTFRLELKVGVGFGNVLTTTVGLPDVRLEFVVAGRGVESCVEAEEHASPGEVVAHDDVLRLCPDTVVGERRAEFAQVLDVSSGPEAVASATLPTVTAEARRTLTAYLPGTIAERMRAGHARFVDEHRRISVLFVGFEGFDYDQSAAAQALQDYFVAVIETITRLGGHLRQIEVGDKGSKYIVLFGAPVAHEDDEERALRCALELRDLDGRKSRTGVACGLTYCGEVGPATRREYAAVGDTVNLAARLMQAAEPGQILATGLSERGLRACDFERRRAITVKGKAEPVPTILVRGVAAAPDAGAIAERSYDLPLVGRQSELRVAEDRLKEAARHGRVLVVTGEAGIGKSRFCADVAALVGRLGFIGFAGACEAHATTTSYFVWHGMWRRFFGLEPTWGLERQLERLEGELARVGGRLASRAPLLGPALNLALPDNELTAALDPELRVELMTSLLVTCVRHRSSDSPLLFVLEDCHWIDPLSDELAAALSRSTTDAPVAVVIVRRPRSEGESATAWTEGLETSTQIRLESLEDSSLRTIFALKAAHLFGLAEVPQDLEDHLIERADGNPFYLEEMLNLLRDRHVAPPAAEAVRELELPETLQSLALARLDTLAESEKATLKVASVIGRLFKAFWLWGAYPALGEPSNVREGLDHLTLMQLTALARAEPDLEYLFRHVVTRDAAYASLTFSLRSELHERVGRFVEEAYAESLDQYVDTLAYHFGESEADDKKRVYFRRAAEGARAVYANDAAIGYLERLLPLTEGAERADVLRALGEVWQLTGKWVEAEEAFRAGLELAEEAGDVNQAARSLCALGYLLSHRKSFAEGRRLLEEANDRFQVLGDPVERVRALEYLAFAAWQQSDHAASLEYSHEQLRLAEELRDPIAACMAIEQEALVHWHRGNYDQARSLFERALAEAEGAGNVRGVIHASNDLAGLHYELGEYAAAFDRVSTGLKAAEEIGYRPAAGWMIGNAGELYRHHGDTTRALACYATALRLMAELRDWRVLLINAGNMGLALAAEGRREVAEALLSCAVDLARTIENPYHLCEYAHHLAAVLVEQGLFPRAAELNDEAFALAREIERRDIRFAAHLLSVRLCLALGETGTSAARGELEALGKEWPDDREQAAVQFELWRADPGDEHARRRAAELYETCHLRAPDIEYVLRYEQLTGRRLPDPPRLPPLVEEPEDVDVEAILDQLGALRRELLAGGEVVVT
jgi:class 3 adenylate cyclase/tetratricopeptide (TPR) repeat protein